MCGNNFQCFEIPFQQLFDSHEGSKLSLLTHSKIITISLPLVEELIIAPLLFSEMIINYAHFIWKDVLEHYCFHVEHVAAVQNSLGSLDINSALSLFIYYYDTSILQLISF